MIATITGKFLELVIGNGHGLPEKSSICIYAHEFKELKMEHPMCKIECKFSKPIDMRKCMPLVSTNDDKNQNKEPGYIGDILTTNCTPKSGLLSKFELDDSNFPLEGIHTQVDLEIMEGSTCMQVMCNNMPKMLRFNRGMDYFNVVNAVE